MKFNTKVIHAGIEPDPTTGAIMTPIYQTSTYVQAAPGDHKGYEYARTQNPTRRVLEQNLAALENGADGICFGSGLAAMDAVLKLLRSGDEVISTNDLYGGSYRLIKKIFEPFGLKSKFIDMTRIENLEKAISPDTKLIWIETPTNPLLNIVDIKAVCEVARAKGIMTCVDNTFASPYLQTPLDLGADLVLGAIVAKTQELADKLHFVQNASGGVCGPMDSFLVLRGIKTLHLRVQRACENARQIAAFLEDHPKVGRVLHPGLTSHPQHELAARQMKDFGAMVSFDLLDDSMEKATTVLSGTHLFSLAESLGGVESLIGHPSSMTHASIPREDRIKNGLTDSLIRLSVGVEDVDDLIADLAGALEKV